MPDETQGTAPPPPNPPYLDRFDNDQILGRLRVGHSAPWGALRLWLLRARLDPCLNLRFDLVDCYFDGRERYHCQLRRRHRHGISDDVEDVTHELGIALLATRGFPCNLACVGGEKTRELDEKGGRCLRKSWFYMSIAPCLSESLPIFTSPFYVIVSKRLLVCHKHCMEPSKKKMLYSVRSVQLCKTSHKSGAILHLEVLCVNHKVGANTSGLTQKQSRANMNSHKKQACACAASPAGEKTTTPQASWARVNVQHFTRTTPDRSSYHRQTRTDWMIVSFPGPDCTVNCACSLLAPSSSLTAAPQSRPSNTRERGSCGGRTVEGRHCNASRVLPG